MEETPHSMVCVGALQRLLEYVSTCGCCRVEDIAKAKYLLTLSRVMFGKSVFDHNGSPSISYVSYVMS